MPKDRQVPHWDKRAAVPLASHPHFDIPTPPKEPRVAGRSSARDALDHHTQSGSWSATPTLVAGCSFGGSHVIDVATGLPQRRLKLLGDVIALSWTPTGPAACVRSSANGQSMLGMYDALEGSAISVIESADMGWVQYCALTHDGSKVLLIDVSGLLEVWDTTHCTRQLRYKCKKNVLAAWSPVGIEIALGDSNSTCILDSQSGEVEVAFKRGISTCVAWHPSGRQLACDNKAGGVSLVERSTLHVLQTVSFCNSAVDGVQQIVFNPSGSRFATASSQWRIRVFDVASGNAVHTVQQTFPVCCVAWNCTGAYLAVAGKEGSLCVMESATGKTVCGLELKTPDGDAERDVLALAWSL